MSFSPGTPVPTSLDKRYLLPALAAGLFLKHREQQSGAVKCFKILG